VLQGLIAGEPSKFLPDLDRNLKTWVVSAQFSADEQRVVALRKTGD
jgi:hypothetical protein